jgi:hypothetical protein
MRVTRGVDVGLIVAPACVVAALVWAVPGCDSGAKPNQAKASLPNPKAKLSPPKPAGPQPKVVADETVYSFGTLDPTEEISHTFVLRNEGKAPLTVTKGTTSCKCLLSELAGDTVPPGGSVKVKLSAQPDQDKPDFSHTATIDTNDPAQKSVELRIQGKVRRYVGIEPPEFLLRSTVRSKPQTVVATVFSQVWKKFTLKDLRSSLEGTTWDVKPSGKATLERFEARSAWDVTVTLPPTPTEFAYQANLHLLAVPEEEEGQKERPLDVRVLCRVPKRVALTGPRYNDLVQMLDLGTLRSGEEARTSIVMTVSDEHRKLSIGKIERSPEFLDVKVTPQGKNDQGEESGVYIIEVRVPKDAPPCALIGENCGTIEFSTGHPEIKSIKIWVTLTVMSRKRN